MALPPGCVTNDVSWATIGCHLLFKFHNSSLVEVVSGIMPPDIRRNKQCLALSRRAEADDQRALHNIVTASTPGRKRQQSRHPFSEHAKQLASDAHGKTNRAWAEVTWATRCDTTRCRLRTFIQTPSNKPIGHDLARYSACAPEQYSNWLWQV